MSVISIKLESGIVEIGLLQEYSPVALIHVCGASFLENTSGGLLPNTDILNVIFSLFFLIYYTFENFKGSVLF